MEQERRRATRKRNGAKKHMSKCLRLQAWIKKKTLAWDSAVPTS